MVSCGASRGRRDARTAAPFRFSATRYRVTTSWISVTQLDGSPSPYFR